MLGQDLIKVALRAGHKVLATDREVDITAESQVREFLATNSVDALVNCAAYTAVDLAESEQDQAFALNAAGPEILALATANLEIPMLHISTDYVFNAQKKEALGEGEALDPVSVYGKTKLQGEIRVQAHNPKHWIVRTAWLYGLYGNNFVKTMLELIATKESIEVVNDQIGTPTWSVDLALAIIAILEKNSDFGVYHYSNLGQTSWYEFAHAIQRMAVERELLEKSIEIRPVPSTEFPTEAQRPTWSVLDKSLIQQKFALEIPHWEESLNNYLYLEKLFRE